MRTYKKWIIAFAVSLGIYLIYTATRTLLGDTYYLTKYKWSIFYRNSGVGDILYVLITTTRRYEYMFYNQLKTIWYEIPLFLSPYIILNVLERKKKRLKNKEL